MPFAVFLLGMVGPMTARILLSLGFSVVSIVGVEAVMGTLKTAFITQMQQFPAAGLQLALLAGAGQAAGIIFGAITTRLILWKVSNATRILGVNS